MGFVILCFCLLILVAETNCLRSVNPTRARLFSRASDQLFTTRTSSKHQYHPFMVPQKMKVAAEDSSLELHFVSTLRFFLYFTPIAVLHSALVQLRVLLKFHQHFEQVIVISEISKQLDVIRLHGAVESAESDDAIIYIHGGGFSICDSSDLMIAEKLLPLLGDNPPAFYSILYDTSRGDLDVPTYLAIQAEVYETYQKILLSGKNILCVIGDSAGGALALNLMLRLQKNIDDSIPDNSNAVNDINMKISNESNMKMSNESNISQNRQIYDKIGGLCLISPWVNFFSIKSCHSKNERFDIIDRTWVSKSKRQYFGKEIFDHGENYSKQSLATEITRKFIKNGIKVVVFDMDQCIVAMHSMGRLRRTDFSTFAEKITEDFLIFARVLHIAGVKLAVGTHSDSIEYNQYFKSETDFIIGDELVQQLLLTVIPELQEHFKIIAYSPHAQNDQNRENAHKKLHIRKISTFYDVSPEECVLFDDDIGNVNDTDGLFNTFQVSDTEGFRLNSYLINQVEEKVYVVADIERKKIEIIEKLTTLTSSVGGSNEKNEGINKCESENIIINNDSDKNNNNNQSQNEHKINENETLYQDITFWKSIRVDNIEKLLPTLMTDTELSDLPPTLIFGGGNEVFIDDIKHFGDRLVAAQDKKYNNNFPKENNHKEILRENDCVDVDTDNAGINEIDVGDGNNTDRNYNLKSMGSNDNKINNNKNEGNTSNNNKNNKNNKKIKSKLIIAENDVHVYPILWRHPVHRVMGPLGLNWLFGFLFPLRRGANDAAIARRRRKDGSGDSNTDNSRDSNSDRNRDRNRDNDEGYSSGSGYDSGNDNTWKEKNGDDDDIDASIVYGKDSNNNDNNRDNDSESNVLLKKAPKVKNVQDVHSKAADDAISEMARFILDIRRNSKK